MTTTVPPIRSFLTPAQRRGDVDFGAIANFARDIRSTPIQPLNNPASRRGQALVASRRQSNMATTTQPSRKKTRTKD